MRGVKVIYHWEPEGFWAESPEAVGFSATDASFEELRKQVRDGLEFHFGEPVAVAELIQDLEVGWTVSQPSVVRRDHWSALWRRVMIYGTEVAGAVTHLTLHGSVAPVTVRSGVAYAGQ